MKLLMLSLKPSPSRLPRLIKGRLESIGEKQIPRKHLRLEYLEQSSASLFLYRDECCWLPYISRILSHEVPIRNCL